MGMQGKAIDLATVFGLSAAFLLIAAAVALGGSPASFVDLPSILIVVGGTFAVTTICFSLSEIGRAQGVILRALFHRHADPGEAAVAMLRYAEKARRDGPLGLQATVKELRGEPFLGQALQLVVDGTAADEIERILRREIGATAQRHLKSASVLRKAAEVAPAMGLIGTLVGLVQMLGNLNNPGAVGPGMAVALLTTFYGAVLANMVFAPLAAKLERNSEEEMLLHNVYLQGAASIGRQENPRRLELLLNTLLPPAKRVRYFD
jgi:chemotaxis protein MotA